MSVPMMTSSWSTMLNHFPHTNVVMMVVFPLICVFVLWKIVAANTAAINPGRKQWVLLRAQDSEGIPLLAEGSSMRRRTQPVRGINPNYRRSDY